MLVQYCKRCTRYGKWVAVRAEDWPRGYYECLGCGAKEHKENEE